MSRFLPEELIKGYDGFRNGRYTEEKNKLEKLAIEGQKPKTMIIACCDSRAAPETIFNAGPGELFVVRNVANLVPPYEPDGSYHSTSAALEFAVQALKVENIVVLGHGRCGGITAALDPDMKPLSPGDFISKWMELLEAPAGEITASTHMTTAEKQTTLERISVRHSVEHLRSFPCIQILEEKKKLNLYGAWYDIAKGELWVMDTKTGDFLPI